MTDLRSSLVALFAVAALVGACTGSAGQASPTRSGDRRTPEEAVAAVVATEPRFTGITAKAQA